MSAHESNMHVQPYYPSRNLGWNKPRASAAHRFWQIDASDVSRMSAFDRGEYLEGESERFEEFLSPPQCRNRAQRPLLLPSRYMKVLAEPLPATFMRLPLELRRRIYGEMNPEIARDVHVVLVSDGPRSEPDFKLYFKAINVRAPRILHLCQESRSYGLDPILGQYKAAFTNYYGDDSIRNQIYINPKLDTIIFELPIEIKQYPRLQILTSTPSPWTNITHDLYRFTNFEWAHHIEWGVDPNADPDDAYGYEYRYNSYIVIVPKNKPAGWEKSIDMVDRARRDDYTCTMVGPVIFPPHTVRSTAPMPATWDDHWRNLVDALESDPAVLQRPLGNSPTRFWA